jgi:hypothetical protein
MPVTANASSSNIVVRSIARRTLEKRRSQASGTRSSAESLSRKPAPPAFSPRNERPSEGDIVQRVSKGDQTVFGVSMRYACVC